MADLEDDPRPSVLRAAAALIDMLNMIGHTVGGGDQEIARVFCENETEIRDLVKFALDEVAEET